MNGEKITSPLPAFFVFLAPLTIDSSFLSITTEGGYKMHLNASEVNKMLNKREKKHNKATGYNISTVRNENPSVKTLRFLEENAETIEEVDSFKIFINGDPFQATKDLSTHNRQVCEYITSRTKAIQEAFVEKR